MGNETLTQWMPERAGRRWRSDEDAVRRATPAVREGTEDGAGDVILVTLGEPVARCDRMALHRAAGLNGLDDRLCEPNRKLEGQAWYDRLARLVDVEIAVTKGDATATLQPDRLADGGANERVDRIVVVGTLEQEGSERRIELTTDLAVRSDLVKMPTAAGVMLAKDSTITLETLQELLHQGLFYVDRDDEEDDGPETQEEDFEQDAHYAACRLLLPSDDAACEIVRYAVEHRIAHLLPKDRAVVIRRPAGAARVEVSFD